MDGSYGTGFAPVMRVPDFLPTKASIEDRVLTACKTIRVLPDRERKFLGTLPMRQPVWQEAVNEWTAYGAEEERERFQPTRAQVSDCFVALAWCAPLEKPDFRIVWARSFGLSWDKIAAATRFYGGARHSRDTTIRRYKCIIDKIYENALRDMRENP